MINPFDDTLSNSPDGVVAKLSSSGDTLLYSTYLGGNGWDWSFGLKVDDPGNVYITGETASSDFPMLNAFDNSYNGGIDGFIIKLSPSTGGANSLLYSSYIGGSLDDSPQGIGTDGSGNAYIAGFTYSNDFPTKNPYDGTLTGIINVFIAKFNLSVSGIESLVYSTYLGTQFSVGYAIAVNRMGNAYITGMTADYDFPMVNAYDDTYNDNFTGYNGDVFISKLSAFGDTLLYSTFLGGGWNEEARGITIDDSGNIYILGATCSTDFPTKNASDDTFNGGQEWGDLFIAKINPFFAGDESLIYSTYLGGRLDEVPGSNGISVDISENIYITGSTASPDFPMMNPYDNELSGYPDVLVAKLTESAGNIDVEINITGGLGVHAVIANNGTADAQGVSWQIHVAGGILGLINKTVNGTIDIKAGESKTVSTGMLLGLGSISISVWVADVEKTSSGTQLFIFSMVKK
jgi:hypothetical protein